MISVRLSSGVLGPKRNWVNHARSLDQPSSKYSKTRVTQMDIRGGTVDALDHTILADVGHGKQSSFIAMKGSR